MKLFKKRADRDAELLRRYRDKELDLGSYSGRYHGATARMIARLERAVMREAGSAPFPVHGRNVMPPRMPFTWFRCQNGHSEMGDPWETPKRECFNCKADRWKERLDTGLRPEEEPEPTVWTPIPKDEGFMETMRLDPKVASRTVEGL